MSRKATFRHQFRTVLFAVVVFGGEAGTLMTVARQETNWAAHLYVYMAVLALGIAMTYLALTGTEESEPGQADNSSSPGTEPR